MKAHTLFLRVVVLSLLVLPVTSRAQEGGVAPQRQGGSAIPSPQSTPLGGDDYTISRQDVLSVTVIDQPQLTKMFTVDSDGSVLFPFVGKVTVAGKTLHEAEAELKRLLADGFLRNPQVAISLDQFKGRRVFVWGAVSAPGNYPLTDGMTVLE